MAGPFVASLLAQWPAAVLGFAYQSAETFAIGLVRRGSSSAQTKDKGSAFLLWACSQGASLAAFLYVLFAVSAHDVPFPSALRVFGLAFGLAGIGVRVWAVRTLGKWFTRQVRVAQDQPVIQHGPYRLVRHPAYTGFLMVAVGFGLALGTAFAFALAVVPTVLATIYRTRIEERALREELGEPYAAYMTRTRRFVPYLF